MTDIFTCTDISDKEEWETFVRSLQPDTFLQSRHWAETQVALGERAEFVGVNRGGELVGVALALSVTAKRGAFLFCPHGPLVRGDVAAARDVHAALLQELTRRARRLGMSFLRVSPLVPATAAWRTFYAAQGFRPAPMHMHAETMWVLDIRPSEEELLRAMRKTTRNLIRRGGRDGVTVRASTDLEDLAVFDALYQETARRERFTPFSRDFLAAEFNAFRKNNAGILFFAEHAGDVLAAALIILNGKTGFYHQGASSRLQPDIPAASVLHWEIIRELKRRECTHYNFWGVAPRDDPQHPWAGLSLFKKGFGGEARAYLHAQDRPLRPQYWLTYFVESARRLRRGV